MSCYISSNANRLYTALESDYGQVPAITAANRIAAVKLTAKQSLETAQRRDKTGSRTFPGFPSGLRRRTSFDLTTYMTSWDNPSAGPPSYGPLFQASLGGTPLVFNGGTVASGSTESMLAFTAPHGLVPEQAVAHGGEIRFVAAIVDALRVQLNAPLRSCRRWGCWAHDHVPSGDRSAEREHLRLLDSSDGGAEDSLRRGGGQAADRHQWGLSPVRVQRSGAGLDRQRQFHERGRAA